MQEIHPAAVNRSMTTTQIHQAIVNILMILSILVFHAPKITIANQKQALKRLATTTVDTLTEPNGHLEIPGVMHAREDHVNSITV